jgi:hypothetical protein
LEFNHAYHRGCECDGTLFEQPTAPDFYTDDKTGRHYIVLSNRRGILAIFRETASGRPKLRERWPVALLDLYREK